MLTQILFTWHSFHRCWWKTYFVCFHLLPLILSERFSDFLHLQVVSPKTVIEFDTLRFLFNIRAEWAREAFIPQLEKKQVQVNNNGTNETLKTTTIFDLLHNLSWLSDDGIYPPQVRTYYVQRRLVSLPLTSSGHTLLYIKTQYFKRLY